MKKLFFLVILCSVLVLSKAASPTLPIGVSYFFNLTLPSYNASTFEITPYNSSTPGKWYPGTAVVASVPSVEANGLSYSTYSENNLGEDIILPSQSLGNRQSYFEITNVTSSYVDGSYYLSFLVNVTAAPASSSQFVTFDKGITGARGRLYIQQTSVNGFALGTAPGSTGPIYPAGFTGEISYGTTHLIVLKYKMTQASLKLDSYVYVDPVVGAAEPGTPNATGLQATYSSDYIRGFDVNQQIGLVYKIGGFRFSNSYSDVNKAAPVVTVTTTASASGLGLNSATDLAVSNGGNLTVDANTSARNIIISGGGQVTLNSGVTLTANNFSINSDPTNGTGTFVDLNPTGGLTLSGTTYVQQNLSSVRNWYMSSPVTNAAAPAGFTYYKYDEPGNNANLVPAGTTAYWESISTGATLTPTLGFITQASGASTFTFTGSALNTGNQSIALTATDGVSKEGFNLVGNPYPSFLNIDGLQTNSDIEPTYWYRSNNGSYVFDTYNIPSSISTGNSGLAVTGYIPPMQAFWLRVASTKSSATVNLSNSMRAHQDNVNNKFRAPATINENQQILRMQVSDGTNSDEAVVYFNANAADGFDAYDSHKMSNNNASIPEIYTLAGNDQVAINGLSSVATNPVLPLGFTTGTSNTFTIKATEVTNFDADTKIVLQDNLLNTEQDLTDGTVYTFTSDVASTTSRFSVVFKSTSITTGLNNGTNKNISVYKNANNQITINCESATNNSFVTVHNALGQLLVTKSLTGSLTVLSNVFSSGVYLVTVTNAGKSVTKKVVLN
jgi:hypothetical protein